MKKRIFIMGFVVILTIVSLFLIPKVKTNYDLTQYLPKDSVTIKGMDLLEDEFGIHSLIEVQLSNIAVNDVIRLKADIKAIKDVEDVIWLDDFVDLTLVPIEFIPEEVSSNFYVNENALLQVTVGLDMYSLEIESVIDEIKVVASNYEVAMRGEPINNIENRKIASGEVLKIMLLIIPVIIIILLVAAKSWIEPVILLISLGIAVALNLGTNIILPNVSYITKTMALALQLALSLDYGLILVHRYYEEREKTNDVPAAIKSAFRRAFPSITASALTTIAGFLSLLFMQYRFGLDIGIVLSKGILLSYATTLIVTPIIILFMHKLIDKTMHKSLIRAPKKYMPFIAKIRYPLVILFAVFTVGAIILSNKTTYTYGNNTAFSEKSQISIDQNTITESFGSYQQVVILVPNGNVPNEISLSNDLLSNEHITKVQSLVTVVDPMIPREFLPDEVKAQFIGATHTRVIIYTTIIEESELLYEFQEQLDTITSSYYDDYYIVGVHQATTNIKDLVKEDQLMITLLSMSAIFIILLITFKSFIIPIILVLVIQSAIWLNLSILFIQGIETVYIGYLVMMAIQLGATIDYAVLLTSRYLDFRKENKPLKAINKSFDVSFITIMISAIVLAAAGFLEGGFSNISSVQEIGLLLGKGTMISFVYVLLFLPALLIVLDKFLFFRKANRLKTDL
ncbi:MAG: MMPL family transporter [Candidatus Izemoplasmatales bacterium]|jgi:hypothetical protein|nr:MMPL family transporter [Candidatus Izemoplasmatales bacterium]